MSTHDEQIWAAIDEVDTQIAHLNEAKAALELQRLELRQQLTPPPAPIGTPTHHP